MTSAVRALNWRTVGFVYFLTAFVVALLVYLIATLPAARDRTSSGDDKVISHCIDVYRTGTSAQPIDVEVLMRSSWFSCLRSIPSRNHRPRRLPYPAWPNSLGSEVSPDHRHLRAVARRETVHRQSTCSRRLGRLLRRVRSRRRCEQPKRRRNQKSHPKSAPAQHTLVAPGMP